MLLPEKSHRRNPTLLDASRSLLVIIDVQENFAKAMADFDPLAERIALLAKAAARIGVPALVTEQYRKGLGPTASPILESIPEGTPVIEKLAFSACDVPEWTVAARDSGVWWTAFGSSCFATFSPAVVMPATASTATAIM